MYFAGDGPGPGRIARMAVAGAVALVLAVTVLAVTVAPGATAADRTTAATTAVAVATDGGGAHPQVKVEHTPHGNRGVLTKGQTFTQVVTLHNRSKKKQRVWLTFGGHCIVDSGEVTEWRSFQRQVTVPRMAAKGWQWEARNRVMTVRAAVSFPDTCWKGVETGDYLGSATVRVTKRRPTDLSVTPTTAQLFAGHPLTAVHARKNLDIITAPPRPVSNYALHRTLPPKHAGKFTKLGLQVDDPRWTDWWCSRKKDKNRVTRKKQQAYVARWSSFFKARPGAGLHQVVEFRRRLAHEWASRIGCS